MSKPQSYWTFNLIADAALFGSLAYWASSGDQGALNVFLVLGWVCAGCAMFIGIVMSVSGADTSPPARPTGATAYQCASHVVFVISAAWFGFLALSACYAIGSMLIESWRHNQAERAA